jgi:hypothetical protein
MFRSLLYDHLQELSFLLSKFTTFQLLAASSVTIVTEQGWGKQRTQNHTVTRDCMCSNKKLLMMDIVVSETSSRTRVK